MKPNALTKKDWVQVVVIAGIGSVLEWYDFFVYSQLDATLKATFFKSETAYWAVFGLAMAARPCGALLFGHIGDTHGRSRSLLLSIVLMAIATCAISILPTYDVGPYTAGAAAPVLLGLFRTLQGLALGGEFSAAVTYISELAAPSRRVVWTACLQATANLGLLLALAIIMILQATTSSYEMDVWGWRIPFALAFVTAMLGAYLRQGMPEPHAFLEAMRAARRRASSTFSKRQLALLGEGVQWEADTGAAPRAASAAQVDEVPPSKIEEGAPPGKPGPGREPSSVEEAWAAEDAAADARGEVSFRRASLQDQGRLSGLHRLDTTAKSPVARVLRNNWMGVLAQTAASSWSAAGYYLMTSWLPSKLRQGFLPTRVSQGILLVSIPFCISGYIVMGLLLDAGVRAVNANVAVLLVSAGTAFGVFYGSFTSDVAAWILSPLMLALVGAGLVCIGVPMTRLYDPLERITGFSLGYNLAMGVVGGFSPVICNAIKDSIPSSLWDYAGPFWLLGMAGLSLVGCAALLSYAPRLNCRFVGKLE